MAAVHPPVAPLGKLLAAGDQPQDWVGIDPGWVYEGGSEALLATALRKVQARIARPADPRYPLPAQGGAALHAAQADPLWRWASQFRIQAVVAALCGRSVVNGHAIWHIGNSPQGQAGTTLALPIMPVIQLIAPRPGQFNYDVQIDKVLRAAVEREDRLPEILSQADDFFPFFESITGIPAEAAPHTMELMTVAWQWGGLLLMQLKHEIAEQRPCVRSAVLHPVIATPGHGSLPSGHATIASLYAALLTELLSARGQCRAEALDRLARRIAFNRVVAGVHFPMDSLAGYELGRSLAALIVALAQGGDVQPRSLVIHAESVLDEVPDKRPNAQGTDGALPVGSSFAVAPLEVLAKLWRAASVELDQLRV
ncbi:phosphatase PAP2 family protein [Paucibacter sp. APW11]|uniref:Phosphatase PAP2 family protein n=1 Tax=Roseateles aquae TaxID=3077235 RepID=A0ABU3PEV2_9BURK|nr:phosphatase PAP2 family protein [Paucibacter sp. APW11]MDT9001043.1 phosphatase PAP2 family protein [Paucibacter sp. APW11]